MLGVILSSHRPVGLLAPLVGVTLFAAVLQLSRLPFRWSAITVAYASYFKEYQHNIDVEGWTAAFTTFVGLHPPLYSLIFHAGESAEVPPVAWLLASAFFSVASVPLLLLAGRALVPNGHSLALVAGLCLAVSPQRNAYGLEINNYPLLMMMSALQLLAFTRFAAKLETNQLGRRDAALWAVATAGLLWTHVLGVALPASQGLVLLSTSLGRRGLKLALPWLLGAVALCTPLLPSIFAGADAPAINQAVGLPRASASLLGGFPGRYGSELAAALLLGLGMIGGLKLWGTRGTAARAAVLHVLLLSALILGMVATGIAAAHQFPYYLALLPSCCLLLSGILLSGDKTTADASAHFKGQILHAALGLALILHLGVQLREAAAAQKAWDNAPTERALMALAIESWTPGSTLVLVDFPDWSDDDKDVVDPTWALIPWSEPVDFGHPGVPTLVTADPYWGQPIRVGGNRWLYTFVGWPTTDGEADRIDQIADHVLGEGKRFVLAIDNTSQAPGDFARAETWAMRRGKLGRSAPNQALWVLEPL